MNRPLTVALCTHNPRPEFLAETLAALRLQTVPPAAWNLLVIDNASADPLERWLDLSWHPAARIVREEKLGTAHARLRVLREAVNDDTGIILFVDDDNVLAVDYLERGLALGQAWPQLGCWGGQLLPRYESPPPAWIENYLKYLAITPLAADRWTNHVSSYDSVPPTAGCFVRPAVWRRYLELVAADPRRLTLGARGDEQVRGEDTDLVLTAIDLGSGVGRFRELELTHLIPAARLTPAYVAKLVEGTVYGTGLLEYLRSHRVPRPAALRWPDRVLQGWRTWRLPEPLRSIRRAELRGKRKAGAAVRRWQQEHPRAAGLVSALPTTSPFVIAPADADFSVLIPAYRAARTIVDTLSAAAAQTVRPREIIVYEDGQLDDLGAKVQEFAAQCPVPVRLISRVRNAGVSTARNTLLAEAQGRYVAFLDADDIWAPDHLATAAAALGAGADVVFSGVTFIDSEGRPLPGRAEPTPEQLADIAPALFHYNFVQCTSTLCLRRSLIDVVGNFDPTLSHGEDLDLWLRLLGAGARFQYSGRCTTAYRKHAGSAMSQTLLMTERMGDFYEKNLSNPLVPLSARRHALVTNRRVHARLNWRRRPAEAARALARLMQLEPWQPLYLAAWIAVRAWSFVPDSGRAPQPASRPT